MLGTSLYVGLQEIIWLEDQVHFMRRLPEGRWEVRPGKRTKNGLVDPGVFQGNYASRHATMCILCVTYGQSLMGSLLKPQYFCIIQTLLASRLNRSTLYHKPWCP